MYLLILSIIFIYLLTVFRRRKLDSYTFVFGSICFFLLIFFGFKEYLVPFMIKFTTFAMGIFGKINNFWTAYADYGIIFIDNGAETISLNIDYECSGFIECLAYISVALFFPVFNFWEKIKYSIFGIIYIELVNLLRLSFISFSVYFYGNASFFLSHSVLGKLIFALFVLYLYFYTLTRTQIMKQRVGNFDYNKDKKDSKDGQ